MGVAASSAPDPKQGVRTMREATKKTTTRRDMMGAAGFTALAGIAAVAIAKPDAQAAAAPTTDDAELVAIGREAADLLEQRKPLEARWWALSPATGFRTKGGPDHDEMNAVSDAIQPIDERLEALSDRAMALRATTRNAWIAKARLIRHEIAINNVCSGVMDFEEMPFSERLAWSLVGDLIEGAV